MCNRSPANNPPDRWAPAEWGMLILLGAIWGGSFFFARIAVAEIPPLTLVLLRVGIAGAALHLYLAGARALPSRSPCRTGDVFALGILNNVIPFSLIFLGQTVLGAGLAVGAQRHHAVLDDRHRQRRDQRRKAQLEQGAACCSASPARRS